MAHVAPVAKLVSVPVSLRNCTHVSARHDSCTPLDIQLTLFIRRVAADAAAAQQARGPGLKHMSDYEFGADSEARTRTPMTCKHVCVPT